MFLIRKWKFTVPALFGLLFAAFLFQWFINRVYVPEGYSLQLRYKGPLLFGSHKQPEAGMWAGEDEVGVRERLVGPGRHFYCPIWWERTIVPDVVVKPGEVAVVTCKLGKDLPAGEFLVDGEVGSTEFKGTLRKVLGPGRYRLNPYGYETKIISTEKSGDAKQGETKQSGWVSIPTGYVGVVTNLADNPHTKQKAGIQDKVLQPGLYPMNPREQMVDVIGVGYSETSINITTNKSASELAAADERGEVIDVQMSGGINFPSSDGFPIFMDFTAIWGLMPNQAPDAIRKFGNIELIEKKVILPQVESICRNHGSEYPAVKLLVGHERELFQNKTVEEFGHVLKERNLSFRQGLVRHIYIPKEVRAPIQMAFIADELKLTRIEEQATAKEEGNLRQAERQVELETRKVEAETLKLVAEKNAEGQKTVGETFATTKKLTAKIERETAELDALARLELGKADAEGVRLVETARSSKFKLAVDSFGTGYAYNQWVFATGLPDDLKLNLFYSGTGTLWTDLKGVQPVLPLPVPNPAEKK